MTSTSPHYNLILFDPTSDTGSTFLTFRTDIAGTSGSTNMMLIDTALNGLQTQITNIGTISGIVFVDATHTDANDYSATVGAISAYTNNMFINLRLDISVVGTATLNINSLGAKNIVKRNSSGSLVNLASGDLVGLREYIFRYSTANSEWIWVSATSGDQVNIVGTSGNFISINTNNSLVDSGIANSSLTHLSGTETITGAKTFSLPPNYSTQSVSSITTLSSASAPIVLVDTTSAAFTLTLPLSPVTGEWFSIIDNTNQFGTHNLTINPNGKNINGSSSNIIFSVPNMSHTLFYNGTQWNLLDTEDSSNYINYLENSAFQYISPTGLTGATATSRYIGATTSGTPSGTWNTGDWFIDQTGYIWIWANHPGNWRIAGGQAISYIPSGEVGATSFSKYAGGTTSGPPVAIGYYPVGSFVIDQSGSIWVCTVVGDLLTTNGTWVQVGNGVDNPITASGNAATIPVTKTHHTVTNNSAATLTITLTTTSAMAGQLQLIRVLDFSSVAQTITWVNTENSTVSVPTTSNGSTTLPLTVGFQYNNFTGKWRCLGVS